MSIVKIKRGLNAYFGAVTLSAGEMAFTTDNGKLYVGNGVTKVLINPDIAANAASATKLETARKFFVNGNGELATSPSGHEFDGTADVTLNIGLATTGVTAGTWTKVTVDSKGRVTDGVNLSAADIPTLTMSKISDIGNVAGLATGIAAGNVPILGADGKLNSAVLPALSISNTSVVGTQAAMLALSAETGDIAVRTDVSKSFILVSEPATAIGNWQELLTPPDVVQSVAGRTGNVVLVAGDVGLANVTNESKATMFTDAALTGIPTAPTAAVGTNTTQIATTAFVVAEIAAATIDCGVF